MELPGPFGVTAWLLVVTVGVVAAGAWAEARTVARVGPPVEKRDEVKPPMPDWGTDDRSRGSRAHLPLGGLERVDANTDRRDPAAPAAGGRRTRGLTLRSRRRERARSGACPAGRRA
jgi:hypothetical protein